jgi:hypothetical protein
MRQRSVWSATRLPEQPSVRIKGYVYPTSLDGEPRNK